MFVSALLLTFGLALPVWAQNDMSQNPESKMELTEAQKKELAGIHEEILEKKFEMVDKHVEFGVITKEMGDKIKEKIQKKADKMRENGYMPRHCHKGDNKAE